jgi:ABC-type glycerol-3-phosphate transport system permease component
MTTTAAPQRVDTAPRKGLFRGITGSKRRTERVQHLALHTGLILGAIVVMIPLVWMVSTSLKAPNQVKVFPPIWIPNPVVWENYIRAVTIYPIPFYIFVWNTFFYAAMVTVGTVASNMVVAYAFARLRFPFSNVLFMIVLATMMLPSQVTMIPLFILFSKLGCVFRVGLLRLPAAAVLQHDPARAGRGRTHRWLRHPGHVLPHHPAALEARHRHHCHLRV